MNINKDSYIKKGSTNQHLDGIFYHLFTPKHCEKTFSFNSLGYLLCTHTILACPVERKMLENHQYIDIVKVIRNDDS